jgi:4-amino-4-deoxy-L-arabinose transferase-like glycosyltransferase
MNRFVHWLVTILVVVWLFLVTLNYYIVHKPFSAENALAMLNALGDVAVAGALVALGAALGHRALRALEFDSPLDALIVQTGLGLGLLALATFALGLVIVHRLVFWALLVLGVFWLRDDVRAVWRDARALQFPIASRLERALAMFVAFALCIGGVVALLPPTAWDAQTYHLVIPKVALEQGRIIAPPDIVYFSFPSLGEMLFLAGMLLKSDIVAQLLHFVFLLLTLGAVFAFALREFNTRVAWLACAILVAVPSFLLVSTWAYVDAMLVFYAFASYYVLRVACERGDARWFALAGAFAGLAMGTKYTAVIVPFALVLLLFLCCRSSVVGRLSSVLRLLSFVILFASPWYLRNLIFTGNPFYPFVFGGKYWDAFRAEWFSRFGTGLLNDPIQLVLAPWHATIYGVEGALGFEATIGPLLLMLVPLLVVSGQWLVGGGQPSSVIGHRSSVSGHAIRYTQYAVRTLVLFVFVLYLFWLLGVAQSKLLMQTRLLFPAFPAFALLAAIAYERLSALDVPQFSLQRFTRLVVLLILGLTALGYAIGFASSGALGYLVGAESRAAYLVRSLGEYGATIRFVNTQLPRDARVLFLWEPRVYYAERAAQPDSILDAWAHLRWQYRDVDAIAAELRARGYTHIVLSRAGLDFILQSGYDPVSLDDARALEELLARDAKQVYGKTSLQIVVREGKPAVLNANEDAYAIYRLDSR